MADMAVSSPTDPMNCGAVGVVCENQNQGGCVDGMCQPCEDTQTDPDNCGGCNIVCGGRNGLCEGGVCQPDLHECFNEETGFTNCDQFCNSVGRTCVAAGCAGATNRRHGSDMQCTLSASGSSGGPCTDTLDWSVINTGFRCCCTGEP